MVQHIELLTVSLANVTPSTHSSPPVPVMSDAASVAEAIAADADAAVQLAAAADTVQTISAAYFEYRAAKDGSESPLTAFVHLLRDGNDYEKQESVSAIATLASVDSIAQLDFALADVVPPLVGLLKDGNAASIRKGAARALDALAKGNLSMCQAISNARGDMLLLEMAICGVEDLQHPAIEALFEVYKELKSVEKEIVVIQASIPALVYVLRSGTPLVKHSMVRLLALLSSTSEAFASRIVEAGGLEPVIDILAFGMDCSRGWAARVMPGLTTEADKNAAVATGVVEPLLALLRGGDAMDQYFAVRAISNIVGESRPVVLDVVAARSLVQCMRDPDDRVEMTSAVIKLAFYSPPNRDSLMEAGVVGPLVQFLRTGTGQEKILATTALGNLSWKHPKNQDILFAAGIVGPIAEELRSEHHEWKRLAANALGDLVSKHLAAQLSVAQVDAIPLVVDLAKNGSDAGKRDALRLLGKLAVGNTYLQTCVGDAGAIAVITDLLCEFKGLSTDVRIAAIRALAKLSENHEANQKRIVEARLIDSLVALWLTGDDKEKRLAGAVLRHIASNSTARVTIESLGAGDAIKESLDEGETKSAE